MQAAADVAAGRGPNVPAGHDVQVEAAGPEKVPAGQFAQAVEPRPLNVPATQGPLQELAVLPVEDPK